MWIHENEFRVVNPIVPLPKDFTILVAFHQQRVALKKRFGIEASIDPVLNRVFSRLNVLRNIQRKAVRKVGNEIAKAAKHIEVFPEKHMVRFYDVPKCFQGSLGGDGFRVRAYWQESFDLEVQV